MTYILRLDSSPRKSDSISRQIADKVEQHLKDLDPELSVKVRDLSCAELPHISNETITGFYTPADAMTAELKAATALSDELIYELKQADTLIISAPMYNFGVPSSLKAWVDQIVRINETFSFDGSSFAGLVAVKRAVFVLAYGASGYAPGGAFSAMNFLEPYLNSLASFLGIEEIKTIRIEGTTGDPEALLEAKQSAIEEISELFVPEVA